MWSARWLSSAAKTRIGALAVAGASTSYAMYEARSKLRCDSPKPANWAQSSHAIAESRNALNATESAKVKHPQESGAKLTPKFSNPLDEYDPVFEDEDQSAWNAFSSSFETARQSLASVNWGTMGDNITGYIVPGWARQIQENIQKLQRELSMAPGSLADEIWDEAHDSNINPEILQDARVRVSNDLCYEEKVFQKNRKQYVRKALAKYLDIREDDIDAEDVPTIALCGSGGGLRALVAGTGSYLSAQEAGLLQCVTYTAGVSGSCWLQTLYHSSLAGRDHERLANHLKNRLGTHIAFPPAALNMLTRAPTNKFLLSGFVEKLKGDAGADFGLVDIYGLLLAARLLVPRGELEVSDNDLKLSNQRAYVDSGVNPMPIYTAVRHEIPLLETESKRSPGSEAIPQGLKEKAQQGGGLSETLKEEARKEAWFQWFEFTPYEFFCEELSAGIPIWALGRPFKDGRNVLSLDGIGLPELRIPLLMGIWGSAFCATLSHYYKEVRPVITGLAGFGGVDSLIEEKNEDLIKIHPIDPATVPNFALGMESKLPSTTPKSIFKTSHLQLMDAGMSNNLPIYPLLRPGRDVDVLIAFDASADIKQENWLSIVDGYAKQRGIKGWPVGAGWPKALEKTADTVRKLDEAQASTAEEAAQKLEQAQRSSEARQDSPRPPRTNSKEAPSQNEESTDLSYCTVWVGSAQERESDKEPPPSKRLAADPTDPAANLPLMEPDAGIAVIYFPFIANTSKVPGVDPATSEFMSTWNFIYTPQNVEDVVALSRANFEEGREQTRRVIRAVYERKRKLRLEREESSRIRKWKKKLREHGDHFG